MKSIYSSDLGDNYLEEFFIPVLKEAVYYKRITGDFSSSFLVAAAEGFASFFLQNGKMELITNGKFTKEDYDAINNGHDPNLIIEKNFLETINQLEGLLKEFQIDRIQALTWLLKTDRLKIKVSIPKEYSPIAIQHTKIGIIYTKNNDKIAFLGGLNESWNAYKGNAEALHASYSWNEHDIDSINRIENIFDKLWRNESTYSNVYEFPEACRNKLIVKYFKKDFKFSPKEPQTDIWEGKKLQYSDKWAHQEKAVKIFLNKKRGILEMATGTGKTVVALKTIKELLDKGHINTVIVTTDGNDLLDQWASELNSFIYSYNYKFRLLRNYGEFYEGREYILAPINSILVTSREKLHDLVDFIDIKIQNKLLLIHDEVHALGSASNQIKLKNKLNKVIYRLGLSATPEREYDKEGTEFIKKHIGSTIYNFSLEDAIKKNILCRFNYYPIKYDLNKIDKNKITKLYALRKRLKDQGTPMSDEQFQIKYSEIYKLSESKIPKFKDFIENEKQLLDKSIIFVQEKEYGEKILPLIHEITYKYHTYYSEDLKEKLMEFILGDLNCLVTCHKISQGIDIRSLKTIILFASSKAKLETIQRMGRCLRSDPDNKDKRANVVDFICNTYTVDKDRKKWLSKLSNIKEGGKQR